MSTENTGMETELALPGAQLKRARERANRSLEDVAHEMHMKVWQLDELENDNYDKLAGAVFVQGYIRTYARLLNVDAAPLLESFSLQKVDEPRWEMHPPVEEAPGKSIWLAVFTALVSAGLVAAFVVWLNANGYLGTSFGFKSNETETLEESMPMGSSSVSALDGSDNGEHQLVLPNQASLEESSVSGTSNSIEESPEIEAEKSLGVSVGQDDETQQVVDVPESEKPDAVETSDDNVSGKVEESASKPLPDETNTEEATPVEKAKPAPAISPSSGSVIEAGVGVVSLSCEEDSWVEVRDANGKLLIHGLRKAGFTAQIDGKAPYQVFLGNAPGVTIEVGDDVFDTSPFVRENRTARFLLLQK